MPTPRYLLCMLFVLGASANATDLDEFKIKRQEVFEFAEGKIVRHLASGVLGPNAPEPFQKNTLQQTLVWDGKEDQGKYIDDKDSLTVRVSLGLKPSFEHTLFWSPQKRLGPHSPLLGPAPEGVYVYEIGLFLGTPQPLDLGTRIQGRKIPSHDDPSGQAAVAAAGMPASAWTTLPAPLPPRRATLASRCSIPTAISSCAGCRNPPRLPSPRVVLS